MNELHKVLVPPRGLFASGKFDQYKRDIPYATLAQAFQSLVRQILSKSEAELQAWRDALREALGPNGLLIVDLIPELELVIGKQPPVPDLSPQDAQRRFQAVLRRFIGVFARPEHPLALFLDDLQWLDAATLDLLEDLLTQTDIGHLLLIGAYRDNEVDATHPLMRKLDAIRRAGATVQDIVLAPLSDGDLGQLIADSLRCETKTANPLVQLVHEKTGGNPFFAIQFLSALADEALLSLRSARMRDGGGTSIASTPNATLTTWSISWSSSSIACRPKPKRRFASLPASAPARRSLCWQPSARHRKKSFTTAFGKLFDRGWCTGRRTPTRSSMTASRRLPIRWSPRARAPKPTYGSADCSWRTRRPRGAKRTFSRS